jgi:hypothetical protein
MVKLRIVESKIIRFEDLFDQQIRVSIIADNNLAENPGRDRDALAIEPHHPRTPSSAEFDVTIDAHVREIASFPGSNHNDQMNSTSQPLDPLKRENLRPDSTTRGNHGHARSVENQVIEFPSPCANNCTYVKRRTGKPRIINVFGMALHVLVAH